MSDFLGASSFFGFHAAAAIVSALFPHHDAEEFHRQRRIQTERKTLPFTKGQK